MFTTLRRRRLQSKFQKSSASISHYITRCLVVTSIVKSFGFNLQLKNRITEQLIPSDEPANSLIIMYSTYTTDPVLILVTLMPNVGALTTSTLYSLFVAGAGRLIFRASSGISKGRVLLGRNL